MPISPGIRAGLREPADQPLVSLGDSDLIATTRGLAPDAGAPTTQAWLKARLRWNHGPARRQVHLARALDEHPRTAAALAEAGRFTATRLTPWPKP